jgi:hypothetical protein
VALVLILALIIAGAIAYQSFSGDGNQQPSLNEEVQGNLDDAVGSFKQLVDDNTR